MSLLQYIFAFLYLAALIVVIVLAVRKLIAWSHSDGEENSSTPHEYSLRASQLGSERKDGKPDPSSLPAQPAEGHFAQASITSDLGNLEERKIKLEPTDLELLVRKVSDQMQLYHDSNEKATTTTLGAKRLPQIPKSEGILEDYIFENIYALNQLASKPSDVGSVKNYENPPDNVVQLNPSSRSRVLSSNGINIYADERAG